MERSTPNTTTPDKVKCFARLAEDYFVPARTSAISVPGLKVECQRPVPGRAHSLRHRRKPPRDSIIPKNHRYPANSLRTTGIRHRPETPAPRRLGRRCINPLMEL